MGRSRKLSLTDWTSANNALSQYFEGNKSKLAKKVGMSRTTVTDFFNEKPIGERSFRKICPALRLNWEKMSLVASNSDSPNEQPLDLAQLSEEQLAQVRDRCRQQIMKRHSRMRLLNGNEVGVDQLYVDVWLLGKPEHKDFSTSERFLRDFDIAQDRLALGRRIQRNPGFEVANHTRNLVILGKPGAGKTTFLKHLAVDWCKTRFQPNKISVLIELRQIREQSWKLTEAIGMELFLPEESTLDLLKQGKLLVLMDGLDEVSTNELRTNVQAQVKEVSEKYSDENRFILTCRTQIMSAIPHGFASVEVADFKPEQVRKFVYNWFLSSGQSECESTRQCEMIQHTIKDQHGLREVMATPVLLSLICVVWQDSGTIPTSRSNLYKKAINWLLRRWNDEKGIEELKVGSKAYRRLNSEDKESLLIEIAAHKFENSENFVLFEQDELVEQISRRLQLTGREEGIDVLKAIEAQHGLLIERADELWSFSHLTFQEYFTVQWLTRLPSKQLAAKIADKQWQRTVEQLVNSQQPADRLCRLIKRAIDQSVAQEPAVQNSFKWLYQKSNSIQGDYESVEIRSFYYAFALNQSDALKFDLALAIDRVCTLDFDFVLDIDLELALNSDLDIALDLNLSIALSLSDIRSLDRDRALRAFLRALDLTRNFPSEFTYRLDQLKEEISTSDYSNEAQNWWLLYGTQWTEKLRQVMIDYRDIGYDWQFTKFQKQQLKRYYETSRFLSNLIRLEGAVSKECFAEIEEGLLLPLAELQRRQPYLYGELNA